MKRRLMVRGLGMAGAAAGAAFLAACGKKGPPEPPNGKESTYPRTYPSE